jgi:hypothetical protein
MIQRWSAHLNGRCWIRAMQGTEVDKALDDCNHAARRTDAKSPKTKQWLTMKLSLKASPKNASSLYGKGLAELRKKKV